MVIDTFTAANTAKGFFSYFDDVLYTEGAERIYLIKGGPGCGKSTFMKKVASHFIDKGSDVERIHCSSDRNSLDGIIIKDSKIAIIDATPPHSYDMKYPGAVEEIIDFSIFWDDKKLKEKQEEIKILTDTISSRYRSVYSLLKAAGNIEAKKQMVFEPNLDTEKILKAIKKLMKQNAVFSKTGTGKVTNRFLCAFSGDGIYTFSKTIEDICDGYAVLDDSLNVGYVFLQKAAFLFVKTGYDIIKIHSPLFPESRPTAIIIPELRFGFISAGNMFSPALKEEKIIKKIPMKTFLDKDFYSSNKNKMNFEKKLIKEIISAVCSELNEIKALHDDLEKIYIEAIDYDKVNSFTEDFVKNL